MEKETIKKQKSYDETTLYFTAINLIKTIDVYVKNQPLVVRDLYCKELVYSVTNIVHKYKECYNTDGINIKIEYLNGILSDLNKIDTTCTILKELKYLSIKQYSNIVLDFGKLHSQTKNFLLSLERKSK